MLFVKSAGFEVLLNLQTFGGTFITKATTLLTHVLTLGNKVKSYGDDGSESSYKSSTFT